jgi:hypothetical protein
MTAPTCEWIEERLPLLSYGDLESEERLSVLAHLEGCAACRATRAELEASAAALASVPLRHPDASKVEGLKGRVLAAVGAAGCPREADLLDADAPDVAEHVAGCAPCRQAQVAFAGVARALDRVPLDAPSAAALAASRATIFARTGVVAPALAKTGRLVRFPLRRALTAAAAILVAVGAFALGRVTAPVDVLALKQRTDQDVRARSPLARGWVAPAIQAYQQVVEEGPREPVVLAARAAEREVEALRALERLQGARTPAAADLEQLMVEFPDAPATFACVFDEYRTWRPAPDHVVSPGITPAGQGDLRGPKVAPWSSEGAPKGDRIPYSTMTDIDEGKIVEMLAWIKNPRLVEALQLQRGLLFEREQNLTEARRCYEEIVAKATDDTPAVRLARERLARI